jgi:hypothetical protein
MQRILSVMLLMVSMVGSVNAKEETGPVADEARKEILKMELDKVPILLEGGAITADWFDRVNDDDLVYVEPRAGVRTKAQVEEQWRSKGRKTVTNHQYDHRVRIYGNGTVGVMSYLGDTEVIGKAGDKIMKSHTVTTDVWIKQDEKWKRLVHHVSLLGPE